MSGWSFQPSLQAGAQLLTGFVVKTVSDSLTVSATDAPTLLDQKWWDDFHDTLAVQDTSTATPIIVKAVTDSFAVQMSRFNVLLYSEQFQQSGSWVLDGSTVSADASTAPNDTATADKLVENSAVASYHRTYQSISLPVGSPCTFSIWAKAAERTKFDFQITFGGGDYVYANFDLIALTAVPSNSGNASGASATITASRNGYYRCSLTWPGITAANPFCYIYLRDASGANFYTGDGVSGLYVWGGQAEPDTQVGNYIPTTNATASADADAANPPLALSTVSDSPAIQLTESLTPIFAITKVIDALAVQETDAANPPNALSQVTDNLAVQLSDVPTPILATTQTTDSLAVIASDATPTIIVVVSVADSTAVQLSDVANPPFAISQVIDALAVILSDATPTRGNPLSVSDALAVQLTDNANSPLALSIVTDSCAIQLSDIANPPFATMTAVDSLTIQLSDTANPPLAVSQVSDAFAIILSDVANPPLAISQVIDSLTVALTEAISSIAVVLPVSDSLQTSLNDIANPPMASSTVTDGIAVQLSDDTPLRMNPVSMQDTTAVQLSDATPTHPNAFAVIDDLAAIFSDDTPSRSNPIICSDAIAIMLDDSALIYNNVAVTDALAAILLESVSPGPQLLSVSEALALGCQDVFWSGPLALVIADSMTVGLSESAAIAVSVAVQDALALQIADSALVNTGTSVVKFASDTFAIGGADAMLSVRQHERENVWGGGARIRPEILRTPYGYRQGRPTPDELKAGTW